MKGIKLIFVLLFFTVASSAFSEIDSQEQTDNEIDILSISEPEELENAGVTGKFKCKFCEKIVGFVERKVKKRMPKDSIKTTIEGFCLVLGRLSGSCMTLVEESFDMMYEMIVSGLEPHSICGRLHACAVEEENSLHAILENDDINDEDDEDDANLGGMRCKVCEKLLHFMGGRIHSASKHALHFVTRKYCLILGPFKHTCDRFVDRNFEHLYHMLKSGVGSHVICARIHACRRADLSDAISDAVVPELADCPLCKFIYNQFKRVFKDHKKTEDIKHVMMIICKELHPSSVHSCEDFVVHSMDDIFAVVVKTPGAKMCQDIGKCKRKMGNFIDTDVSED